MPMTYDSDSPGVSERNTPEIFVLTEKIRDNLAYISMKLKPVLIPTPEEVVKEVAKEGKFSTPLIEKLKTILKHTEVLKTEIHL